MGGDETAALQALTSFTVVVGLHKDRTDLDVLAAEGQPPVARMSKTGPLRKRAAYELFTGPDLKTLAGTMSASGGLDAAGTPFGIVNLTGGKVPDAEVHPLSGGLRSEVTGNPTRWRVVQPGLPPLAGRAVDRATQLRFNAVTDAAGRIGADVWMPDYVLQPVFQYSAPGCEGFTVKLKSRTARLEVTAHDARVDRRLIMAVSAALALLVMEHGRKDLTNALDRKSVV